MMSDSELNKCNKEKLISIIKASRRPSSTETVTLEAIENIITKKIDQLNIDLAQRIEMIETEHKKEYHNLQEQINSQAAIINDLKKSAQKNTPTATGDTDSMSNIMGVIKEANKRRDIENNIIIFGLEEKENELDNVKNFFKEGLELPEEGLNEAVRDAKRLGRNDIHTNKPRPLCVKLIRPSFKGHIFNHAKHIHKHEHFKNIKLENDFTFAQRQEKANKIAQANEKNSTDKKNFWQVKFDYKTSTFFLKQYNRTTKVPC